MRTLIVHFSGGSQVSIQTEIEPASVFEALSGGGEWLVIEDTESRRHYLATNSIAYLAFDDKKGIGFA